MPRRLLSVLGIDVVVDCADPVAQVLLSATYGAGGREPPLGVLRYEIARQPSSGAYVVRRDDEPSGRAADVAELLWLFEGDVAVELQKRRADLYFVHAAVLERGGRAVMLVAQSGAGKSLTAWALLHHGFGYLSDELAPIDLDALAVLPYQRALSLKEEAPAPYAVPRRALRTGRSIHIAVPDLPARACAEAIDLAATLFLRYDPEAAGPSLRRLSPGEGAARLYANTLNALAHRDDGLEGAIRIAAARPCYEVVSTELTATAALVEDAAPALLGGSR